MNYGHICLGAASFIYGSLSVPCFEKFIDVCVFLQQSCSNAVALKEEIFVEGGGEVTEESDEAVQSCGEIEVS